MADEALELDELVQVPSWHSAATTNNNNNSGRQSPDTRTTVVDIQQQQQQLLNKTNLSSTSSSGTNNNQTLDDSTTNGFTTAPATSDDDFDSDDDDDSRSMCSNKNTSNSGNAATSGSARYSKYSAGGRYAIKGEQKRSHHNVLERKRRDLLKDSFAALRESVPMNNSKERISRAEILKQAANFIQSTAKRNASVRLELEELIRKNREFEEKRNREAASSGGSNNVSGLADLPPIAIASSSKSDASQLLGPAEVAIKQEL